MKQPVWILNSSLLILFFMSQLFLFMLQKSIPRRVSISPGKIEIEQEQAAVSVDIATIYENDLFGTYQPPVVPREVIVDDSVEPMPRPPKSIIPEVPVEKVPTFFAPLDVVLKGVIFVKDDPANCIAIVQLKKTKEERNYQVGDLIEDAQILKILSNRIIIIRSNGQQETLYLREEDAVSDFNTEVKSEPKMIVENSSDNKYIINIDEFIKRIHNLGEFINLLDLTTVYKQGKSFGCRIGKVDKDSLGGMLGFIIDDIIIKIDDYHVDDLANRIKVYDHITQKKAGDMIEVVLYRGDNTITLMYALIDNVLKSVSFTPQQLQTRLMEELSKHEVEKLKTASEQAVVIQSILEDEISKNIDIEENQDHQQDLAFMINMDEFDESSKKVTDKKISLPVDVSLPTKVDTLVDRLQEEKNKLTPVSHRKRERDRKTMAARGSKNVISNGI